MNEIKANMAGSIWRIMVKEGDWIEAYQDVVILESMKMEIPIASDKSGKVKEIKVREEDFVNDGDTLIIVES